MLVETERRCMSPLLSTPVLLEPGADAVAKPSLVAVSRRSLPLAAVSGLEPPEVSASWIPLPAALTWAVMSTGVAPDWLLCSWIPLLMSSITSCSVTAPDRLTLHRMPVAVGERHGAQGPQPLTAVEIGEEHGLQPPENPAARDGAAVLGGTDQPQVAGRGGTGDVGDRELIVAARRVCCHQALTGDRDLQAAVGLRVDLLDDAGQGRLAGQIDRAFVTVSQSVVDVAHGGRVHLDAHAVVQGLKQHRVQPADGLAARDRGGGGGIDQPENAGRGGTRGIGDRERVAGILAGRSRIGDHQALTGKGCLQFAVGLAVDLLDDVVRRRIAAELREVDRALSAVVQGVVDIAQGERVHFARPSHRSGR